MGDIALSAAEGALTSGGSAVKKAFAKGAIIVGSEVLRNTVDVTSEGVNVNSAEEVVVNTAIGLTLGKTGEAAPSPKGKIVKNVSQNKAVKKARAKAKSEGKVVDGKTRTEIVTKTKKKNAQADGANKTFSKSAQNSVAVSSSETVKRSIEEEK